MTTEDVRSIKGISLKPSSTGIGGTNAVGTVEAVGSGVSGFAANDTVLVVGSKTWCNSVTVPVGSGVAKVSPKMSIDVAATLPSMLSAWAILTKFTKLQAGDTVIQGGGDGAVSQCVNIIGKSMGVKVVNISAADAEDAKKVASLGPAKLAITGSSGKFSRSLMSALAKKGTLVIYNGESSPMSQGVDFTMSGAIFNDVSLSGFDFNTWAASNQIELKNGIDALSSLLEEKKITPPTTKFFDAADFKSAFASMESSGEVHVFRL